LFHRYFGQQQLSKSKNVSEKVLNIRGLPAMVDVHEHREISTSEEQ
jgi:hypothetical protein